MGDMLKVRRKMRSVKRKSSEARKFNVRTLEKIHEELVEGLIPLNHVVVSDPETPGLMAFVRKKAISFNVQYNVYEKGRRVARGMLIIGYHPMRTIGEARKLANTINALSRKGVDPAEGLHDRLMRELLEQGEDWRP